MALLAIDENLDDADWTKQTWDLLHIRSREDLDALLAAWGITLAEFYRLPVYRHALVKGTLPDWLRSI